MNVLTELGWRPAYEELLKTVDSHSLPARVAADCGTQYVVWTAAGEFRAEVRKRKILERFGRPAVGDWVALRPGDQPEIVGVLPRQTELVRRAAGDGLTAQVVASNIDTVFVVSSLNREFNPRRIDRYLTVIWEGGADPVIVLSKADLAESTEPFLRQLTGAALAVPTHVVCGHDGQGVNQLLAYVTTGSTVAMVGSSGVGKSTLINAMVGSDMQEVKEIRSTDDHGRHTTTRRELIRLPDGGLIVDTPGMRELGLWTGEDGVQAVFGEIERLAESCGFRDCSHNTEPDCAVTGAIDTGELTEEELVSYRKLSRELAHQARRVDESLAREEHRRWKTLSKHIRKVSKINPKNR